MSSRGAEGATGPLPMSRGSGREATNDWARAEGAWSGATDESARAWIHRLLGCCRYPSALSSCSACLLWPADTGLYLRHMGHRTSGFSFCCRNACLMRVTTHCSQQPEHISCEHFSTTVGLPSSGSKQMKQFRADGFKRCITGQLQWDAVLRKQGCCKLRRGDTTTRPL